MNGRTLGKLTAITSASVEKPTHALVLIHGVGSNEQNLLELGSLLANDRLIVSLRAPIALGTNAFAWFHVTFTADGPVHNSDEAQMSLSLIEEAIQDLSIKSEIPLENISVFGFSQGAILTIGLALKSKLPLESYIAASGRTLPEFAESALSSPLAGYKDRKIFVAHGVSDSKLPVRLARNTEKVLRSAGLDLTYKEYQADHFVSQELIMDMKKWLPPK